MGRIFLRYAQSRAGHPAIFPIFNNRAALMGLTAERISIRGQSFFCPRITRIDTNTVEAIAVIGLRRICCGPHPSVAAERRAE